MIQVFDQNGNSGPRIKIGCITIKNGNLPTPMLAEPTSLLESGGTAQLQLSWFCDSVGVERFEIWCASTTQADPGLFGTLIGPKLGTLPGTLVDDDSSIVEFCDYQTSTVRAGQIGNGAEFKAILNVPAGQELTFAVRAVGKGSYQDPPVNDDARPAGPFSNVIEAKWAPPPEFVQDVIPWPALGVPGASNPELEVANYQPGEGPFFALPLLEGDTHSSAILMGAYNAIEANVIIEDTFDPMDIFFTFRKQNVHPVSPQAVETIYPFVIYRHQVASNLYPNAVPNLVQVSPLIDRLTYQNDRPGERRIRDPFFRFVEKGSLPDATDSNGNPLFGLPVGGTFSRTLANTVLDLPEQHLDLPYLKPFQHLMFWVDPMPVVKNARYQYLTVHFDDRGEIERVIPTNTVQH